MKHLYLLFCTILFSITGFSQSYDYTVQTIPFQEYQEQNIIQFNADDVYSGVIDLPFEFDFYNLLNRTQLVVGSNADIIFDLSLANTLDNWDIGAGNFIPTTASNRSATIFSAFHDIDNSQLDGITGGVYYGVSGESPNRRFYIFYENVPQFSCSDLLSTLQLVLHETTNIIDVYVKNKPVCEAWNGGRAIIGLQNEAGTKGIAAPGRNNTVWDAQEEGWRFKPTTNFNVVVCDVDNDNSELFNIDDYKTRVLSLFNLDASENTIDILDNSNVSVSGDINISSGNNIFTIVMNPSTDNVQLDLTVSFTNCDNDNENDGIPNNMEDANGNGDLGDDDTDGDGIPNYQDNDDDGDTVISEHEIVFGGRSSGNSVNLPTFLDTDNDGIPNHLDMDDDGDGVITLDEDYDGNGDPSDDDLNGNDIPDYLEAAILNVEAISLNTTFFTAYPNPTKEILNVQFPSQINFSETSVELSVFDLQGRQILQREKNLLNNKTEIDVSNLSTGHYLLVVKKDGITKAKKFVVE